jgi:hypothetical protein
MELSGTRPAAASAEARLPRWNVWFIATVMLVFTAILAGLAAWFWVRSPHMSSRVPSVAMFAVPFLAGWYLDRVCPRRLSATPDGLRWRSFVLGRERHAAWDAIAEVMTVRTSTNYARGDVWLRLGGRRGRVVLPGQMIGRDDLLAVLHAHCPAAVS